ncbi:MAG TPA: SUMF1/EgtB/PvdO family nonheme iron enzyme [Chitinophagaceae bacterium]|nr:SUMF1/EgtB/PvdO family nonheme iron enzyme [Chitinophagaceae bacterium]
MHKHCTLFLVLTCSSMLLNAQSFTARFFTDRLVKVKDSLYAWKYETSNADYRTFLNYLQVSAQQALYEQYEVDSTQWAKIKAGPLAVHYHRHSSFGQYPVVNVSYEAALAYCQWLSDQYHAVPKRKFAKVQFVLPTEAEWMEAAEGGRSQAMFPWGNYYLRNNKGQFMYNFKHVNDGSIYADSLGRPLVAQLPVEISDRAIYTATVKSFWPNDFGIYNFCGNVSEMVAEKTFTKGGSWNSYGAYVRIRAQENYKGPSPQIGFRVFMRVLEH